MPLLVYLDEVGNPTLENTDKDFPVFAIALLVFERDCYFDQIVPRVHRLKFKWFGHEGVILHSRDIRKRQGDFIILTDPTRRAQFIGDINDMMTTCDYKLLAVAVRKDRLVAQYRYPADPYELALLFALERLLSVVEAAHETDVTVIAERRGAREDRELYVAFQRIVTSGTAYISGERFRKVRFRMEFAPKSGNVVGTQMADLAAYPIARRVLDQSKPNPAYEVVRQKLCRQLKIFP